MADASASSFAAAVADRYRVVRELGQGGMAIVYLAEDLKHRRQVAIKVVRPELAGVMGADRFLREIEIAAGLHHPHILPLYDSGEARAAPHGQGEGPPFLFYVMPYVDGQSLRDRLAREHELPIDEAVRIAPEVADALSYAHSRGVVHRDIKPENILIDAGHAVVADFGIARAVSAAGGDALTATGVTLGTPPYMSPEQAAGNQELDGRSDLYSLACVLYEMLGGKPPFTGPTAASVIHQHISADAPPITQLRPAVSAELAGTLARALAKVPADRFNPVAQFAEALGPRPGSTTDAVSTKAAVASRRLWLRLAAAAAGAAVLAGGYWLLAGERAASPSAATSTPRLAVLPFTNLGSADDEYFAEGVTDEVTSRTGQVPGLEVIARSSAAKYGSRDPDLATIGRELNVQYVLEGSIRWQRAPNGPGRVRVTPELIRVADGTQLWTERYDAVLADIFQVQTDIAEKVATALGVALRQSDSAAAPPTRDLEAYDLYLQAKVFLNRGTSSEDLNAAAAMCQQAVARDSSFALAWAHLAYAHAIVYWFRHDPTQARLARAKAAVDRAVALQPGAPEVEWAQGHYAYWGHRDYERALEHFNRARQARPNDADVIAGIAAVERRQGRFDAALADFARSLELDPRSAERARGLAETYRLQRRYAEAIRYFDRAITLAPDQAVTYVQKAEAQMLWTGAMAEARRTLDTGAARGAREPDQIRFGLAWLDLLEGRYSAALDRLREVQSELHVNQLVVRPRAQYQADLHRLMGHEDLARAYEDSAVTAMRRAIARAPGDATLVTPLGIAYAGLGRREVALREGRRAVQMLPLSKDRWGGAYLEMDLARIHARLGDRDSAIAHLEHLLSIPSDFAPALLRVDPEWIPLRNDPRFKRLTAGAP